jgi:hypothetical protein
LFVAAEQQHHEQSRASARGELVLISSIAAGLNSIRLRRIGVWLTWPNRTFGAVIGIGV